MKRLDLSCLPINLEVGETMELIDKEGKYHLLRCDLAENKGSSCDGCFFSKIADCFICNQVKCYKRERGQGVRYVELPGKDELREESEMKTLTFDDLSETKTIKAGETFIYVDEFDKQHRITTKEINGVNSCERCVFNNDACCLVNCLASGRESKDSVYFVEQTKTQ